MARSRKRPTAHDDDKPQRRKYTPAELFVALIGVGVLVLIIGMIVSEFLE